MSQTEDPPVPADQLVGHVVRVLRPRFFHQLVWCLKRRWGGAVLRIPRNWRIWLVRKFYLMASGLEFFAFAILRPRNLVESNRLYFERQMTNRVMWNPSEELFPLELEALNQFPSKEGKRALVLGCGSGREAIALAQKGWRVTGIDHVPNNLRLARERASPELGIEWRCQDITQEFSLGHSFDGIFLWCHLYHHIPTRRLRIQLLRNCRAHLKSDGLLTLNFPVCLFQPSKLKIRAQRLRKGWARLVGGNRECELGDRWERYGLFFHLFSTAQEVVEETKAAGLEVEWLNDQFPQKMLVLKSHQAEAALATGFAPSSSEKEITRRDQK